MTLPGGITRPIAWRLMGHLAYPGDQDDKDSGPVCNPAGGRLTKRPRGQGETRLKGSVMGQLAEKVQEEESSLTREARPGKESKTRTSIWLVVEKRLVVLLLGLYM